MGDFGRLHSEEKLPWDGNANSSPPHTVTLDSYSISRYKVTLAEFDLYAEANNVPSVQTEDIYTRRLANRPPSRAPNKPAGATWKQADAYCRWLGELANQPFSLPTEAQWEYAARSRGRWVVYPTDNGKLEWNRNVPSYELIRALNSGRGSVPYPIAIFPPNPLGLYDLTINSLDWVQDWYAADWYRQSEDSRNPTGPESGTAKVQRSWPASDDRAAMTMTRRFENPEQEPGTTEFSGFRCALQSPQAVRS